jgi:hypothetical protein
MTRIISISASPGWSAVFEVGGDNRTVTLAAWALIEDGDATRMVGLVQKGRTDDTPAGTFGFAEDTEGFAGYTHEGLKTRMPAPAPRELIEASRQKLKQAQERLTGRDSA